MDAQSQANYGVPAAGIAAASGLASAAFLTGAPLNLASALTGNPNAQAAFASSRAIASGMLRGAYPSNGSGFVRTFSSSATFNIVTTTFAGTEPVKFALLDAQTLGTGFSSMTMRIFARSVQQDLQTFATPAAAIAYMKDRVYSFGLATGNPQIQVTLDVTASAANSGFAATFGTVVTDGSAPTGFAAWAATNTVPADYTDFDNDGLNNFLEYALGLNPRAADGFNTSGATLEPVSGSTYLTLTINRASLRPDVVYRVEVSTNLAQWNSGPSFTTTLTDTPTQFKVRSNTPVTPTSPPQFLRLVVVPQ